MWSLYVLVSGIGTAARMEEQSVGREAAGSQGGDESRRSRKAKFVS